jgi:hypothetical protein
LRDEAIYGCGEWREDGWEDGCLPIRRATLEERRGAFEAWWFFILGSEVLEQLGLDLSGGLWLRFGESLGLDVRGVAV